MLLLSTVILSSLLMAVNAHFLLNYPPTRGFDEDKEPNFCGGFPLANNRSQFPLSGGFVAITSEHPQAQINVLISFDANPTSFSEFNTTSSGQRIPFLVPFTNMNAQGDACFPVNISSLGVPAAQNGANATIQVEFNGPDGLLFQCSDVVLSNSFNVPSDVKCDNATGAFSSSNATSNSSDSNGGVVLSTAAGAATAFAVLLGALTSLL